jgi:hypothetical protein
MRFERFHGLALLAFGALLLFVQEIVIFGERSSSAVKTAASERRAETESRPVVAQFRELEYLPGIIGIALSGAGVCFGAGAGESAGRRTARCEKRLSPGEPLVGCMIRG